MASGFVWWACERSDLLPALQTLCEHDSEHNEVQNRLADSREEVNEAPCSRYAWNETAEVVVGYDIWFLNSWPLGHKMRDVKKAGGKKLTLKRTFGPESSDFLENYWGSRSVTPGCPFYRLGEALIVMRCNICLSQQAPLNMPKLRSFPPS